jgi:hypothetical protein
MDRKIVYAGAIPLDTDLLTPQRNAMTALGWLLQSVMGTATGVVGLACAPTAPPSLTVNVGPGAIWSLEEIDQNAYGSLAPDTSPLMKMGILPEAAGTNFTLTAPTTSGQSINYLIEATFQEADGTPIVLPYVNPANPSQPFAGPNGNEVAQNTARQQLVELQLKAGAPASTGSQTTPPVDSGFVGLWVVTVAFGQTTITAGSIAGYPGAPFVPQTLPQISAALAALGQAASKAVTNNALPDVASVTGTFTPGHLLVAADAAGTVEDGGAAAGFLQVANDLSELTATAATARTNISAAKSGANTDITSLATPTVTAPARYDNSSRIVSSAFVALAAPHVEGFYKNLKISGSPGATSISYSADSVVLMTTSFVLTDGGLSGTINLGSSGVINGLDTGTLNGNTAYYIWAVSNGTTFGAVASLSNSAPNAAITGTYPFVAYIGSFRTGTSGILGFVQSGARTRYVASSTQTLPLLGTGDSSGVFRACSVSSVIPPSAQIISVQLSGALNSSSSVGAAPNNAIAFGGTANFPYLLLSNAGFSIEADWVLESSNVYIASTGSISGSLYCLGYINGKL